MNGLKFWNALKFGFQSFLKPHAYLDILLKKDIDGHLSTKHYDKRDDFHFTKVTLFSFKIVPWSCGSPGGCISALH